MIPTIQFDSNVGTPLKFVRGVDSVLSKINIRIFTQRGDVITDVNFGIPWERWNTTMGITQQERASAIRYEINQVEGATVVSMSESWCGGIVTILPVVDIRADDTIERVQLSIDPYQTFGAPSWWSVARNYGVL